MHHSHIAHVTRKLHHSHAANALDKKNAQLLSSPSTKKIQFPIAACEKYTMQSYAMPGPGNDVDVDATTPRHCPLARAKTLQVLKKVQHIVCFRVQGVDFKVIVACANMLCAHIRIAFECW
jgi:hypothetical protein